MHGGSQPPFLTRAVADPGVRLDIRHAREWTVPPTVYWGRTGDQRWTVEDRAILSALDGWEATLCPGCHQPYAEHRPVGEYTAASVDCPQLEALERDQVAQAHRDGTKDAKADPERSRRWIAGTRHEVADWVALMEHTTD